MRSQIQVLQIVWMVMGLSQLILLAPGLYVLKKDLPRQDIGGNTLLIFTIVLMAIATIFPEWWYRKRLPEGAALKDPEKKLEHYRAPLFLGWVLIEAANMVALIAFLLNRNPLYLGLFGLGFALFYFRRADAGRFFRDYRLSETA
jgi:hypothetical protein